MKHFWLNSKERIDLILSGKPFGLINDEFETDDEKTASQDYIKLNASWTSKDDELMKTFDFYYY